MIGTDFISFLILLVISLVVSGILHYGLNLRNPWILVVLLQGGRGLGRCLDGPP
jgi:hypothetical protein